MGKSALLDKAKQMVRGYQMILKRRHCYRDESDFLLRPWNDIFWEIDQCVENGILEKEIVEDEKGQIKRILKGVLTEGEEKMGRLTYQILSKVCFGNVPKKLQNAIK